MPIALTPRRRSRDEAESGSVSSSASPDIIPSSQITSTNTKRARLTNGYAPSSSNRTSLTNGAHASVNGLQKETLRSKSTRRKYQPGSIVRVKLTNFVTYTDVEFHPGPSLNMVIGPNGTGKSTLVCAICLGLGWGPQHLGRAKEVSEFVKHGCQEATIEIELAKDGKKFQNNIVIRCTIKRDGNKSIFSINDRPQGKKAVMELCRSLSIQIDNLCQFLPQDKVVEFAAMTPVELLKSTQRAVASQEMIDMHEELKEYRRKQKDAQANNAADQDTLANLETRHRGQEADVERMREREKVMKRVEMLEASRPFPAYRTIRNQRKEARERKLEAQRELTKLKDDVEPSLRAYNEKEQYKSLIETVVRERKAAVTRTEREADVTANRFKESLDLQNELVSKYNAEMNTGKSSKQELPRLEHAVSDLKRRLDDQPPDIDVAAYNERIRSKQRHIVERKTQTDRIQERQREMSQRGREKNNRIQQLQQELSNLDSQSGKQYNKLRSVCLDTAKLLEWVQQHQDQFEKPVLGPPLVECSVKDPKYADHLESLVRGNDMLAIICQTKNDMSKLSDVAASQHLTEVYIKTMMVGIDSFRTSVDEQQMKRFGFESWAIDQLNGPEPILAQLCGEFRLHQTGISVRETTQQQFQALQNSPVQSWVTGRTAHRINRRREYGPDATSTNVQQIRPARFWTDQPVDLTVKRELEEKIQELKDEVNAIKDSLDEAQKELTGIRDEVREAMTEEKEMAAEKAAKQKAMGEFKALPTRLAALEEKEKTARGTLEGMRARLKDILDQQNEAAMKRAQIALEYARVMETLRTCHESLHEAEIMLIEASSDCEVLKERNRSVTELIQTQTAQVEHHGREYDRLTHEAQKLLQECQRLLGDDIDPELKEFFRNLPPEQPPQELEAEIESEKARLELMHEGNGSVIREYQARQKRIGLLTDRLTELNHALAELDSKIKELRDQWEPELDRLVAKISDSFSTNMEQISCAGEVSVYKDDDFDQWAIQIRVKFRENEPLTTLDSHRQSGGERAVSTIFYLMSLQSLTKSPFRVVDEINQGMDPRNERLVHKRMVGIACGKTDVPSRRTNGYTSDDHDDDDVNAANDEDDGGKGGSQYFLITPKLLHNLTYVRGMRVLCIASGEWMPEGRGKCSFQGAIETMRGLKAGWRVAAG